MNYPAHKILFVIVLGTILLLGFTYLLVFGRALGQQENHAAIVLALPKIIFGSGVARIDNTTYLAKDADSFTRAMEQQGFTYIEQFGSGYVFRKDGANYTSSSRMYSSYVMLFTYPTKIVQGVFKF